MVTTLDGSANGADGLSGTIGGAADRAVFSALRGLADVILVGAGTARAEGYRRPVAKPDFAERRTGTAQWPAPTLAIVTRSGDLPTPAEGSLFGGPDGAFVVTCADADVARMRSVAGEDRVIVAGEDDVDPVIAVAQLAARGMRRVLLEGGPSLLGRTVAAGRLDELCLTVSPLLVAGDGPRVAFGDPASLRLRVAHLIACDDVLLGRWLVLR
jgi:5-amino-6-(5-phosphoribosylamino)uracil reductase